MTTATEARNYRVELFEYCGGALRWRTTEAVHCADLDAAKARVEAWRARYPKGFAARARWAVITSDIGIRETEHGSFRADFRTDLDTRRKAKID